MQRFCEKLGDSTKAEGGESDVLRQERDELVARIAMLQEAAHGDNRDAAADATVLQLREEVAQLTERNAQLTGELAKLQAGNSSAEEAAQRVAELERERVHLKMELSDSQHTWQKERDSLKKMIADLEVDMAALEKKLAPEEGRDDTKDKDGTKLKVIELEGSNKLLATKVSPRGGGIATDMPQAALLTQLGLSPYPSQPAHSPPPTALHTLVCERFRKWK